MSRFRASIAFRDSGEEGTLIMRLICSKGVRIDPASPSFFPCTSIAPQQW